VTYFLLHAVAFAVARLPRRAAERFGVLLGVLAGSVLRIRRAIVEEAIVRALGVDASAIADRMYRDLGRGLVELLWLAGGGRERRKRAIDEVRIDDGAARAFDDAARRGPVVVFASHTGNWELAAAAAARLLGRRGKRLFVVAKPMHARGVDRFLARLRREAGVEAVAPRGALSAARRALAAGDVVVTPIDQVPDRAEHAVSLPFLGAPALVDRAPATLAWRSRATVLVVAAERAGDGGHLVRVIDAIHPPAPDERDARAWILETTRRATAALDRFVRSVPHGWLWLHRRWRAPRAAAASREPHAQTLRVHRPVPSARLVAPRKAG